MNKEVDLEADTIKVMLLNNSHAFTATHNVKADVVANELANGNGYTTGGATLAGKAVTQAATTKWDATDVEWTDSTLTAYHAVIYDDTTANDDLICSFDFGGAQITSNSTITLQFHADGIISLA